MHGGMGQFLRLFIMRLPPWARALLGAALVAAGLALGIRLLAVLGAVVCAHTVAEAVRRRRARPRRGTAGQTGEEGQGGQAS